MKKTTIIKGIAAAFVISALSPACTTLPDREPVSVELANAGVARHPVVVAPDASERVRKAARDLASKLEQITGAPFEVVEADGTTGIAVGDHRDFPALALATDFNPNILSRREEYLLRTHQYGLHLIGATDMAAQHAVWDFLSRLGYRQLMPTDTWEIIPRIEILQVSMDTSEAPDFYNRDGPRPAPWSDGALWRRWQARNRMTSAFFLRTGHAYDGIIRANRQAFEKNPEFFAKVDGKHGGGRSDKFCIANEGLRELIVQHAVERIDEDTDSISMDPSDGGDWCECDDCAQMGSVSDRVVILANEVAAAMNDLGFESAKYAGIYAYNEHSPPPSVEVHPNVIVSIATAFIRGGYSLDQLLEGWGEKTEMIGIRDYHDVILWSQGMPLRARGGNVSYLTNNIPRFYKAGARFMNSESSDSWGPNGLGYYLSGLLLWDVDAAKRADRIIDDFVEKAFESAFRTMREFYRLLAEDHGTFRTNDDLLARMYGSLDEAYGLTDTPHVLTRLDELTLYTRYVELMFQFNAAEGDEARVRAAQKLSRHTYRMRDTMLVHVRGLYSWLRRRGVDPADPGVLRVGTPGRDEEPWMSHETFSDEEIAGYLRDGLATYKKDVMDFEPVAFSNELVPAFPALELPQVTTGDFGSGNTFRGRHEVFTWMTADTSALDLEVAGGLISWYRDRGNVRFRLYSPMEVFGEPVDTDESVPPDGETYTIRLESPYEGLHRLEWNDGSDRTRVVWSENHPVTIRSSMDAPARLPNNRRLYFYVPKGTSIVGGFTTGNANERTQVYDGDGNRVFVMSDVEGGEGYFSIPVPDGQDGTLWEFRRGYGRQMLMTVPPYLARNEQELLLPKEVVEADRN